MTLKNVFKKLNFVTTKHIYVSGFENSYFFFILPFFLKQTESCNFVIIFKYYFSTLFSRLYFYENLKN